MGVKNRNRVILSGYCAYLNGAPDDDLAKIGLNVLEIDFIKKFHEKAAAGAMYCSLLRWHRDKPKSLIVSMFELYTVHKNGLGIPREYKFWLENQYGVIICM